MGALVLKAMAMRRSVIAQKGLMERAVKLTYLSAILFQICVTMEALVLKAMAPKLAAIVLLDTVGRFAIAMTQIIELVQWIVASIMDNALKNLVQILAATA
jgi:hypothetical protein